MNRYFKKSVKSTVSEFPALRKIELFLVLTISEFPDPKYAPVPQKVCKIELFLMLTVSEFPAPKYEPVTQKVHKIELFLS